LDAIESTRLDSMNGCIDIDIGIGIDIDIGINFPPLVFFPVPRLDLFRLVSSSLVCLGGTVVEQDVVLLVGIIVLLLPALFLFAPGGRCRNHARDRVRRLGRIGAAAVDVAAAVVVLLLVRRVAHRRFLSVVGVVALVVVVVFVVDQLHALRAHVGFDVLEAIIQEIALFSQL